MRNEWILFPFLFSTSFSSPPLLVVVSPGVGVGASVYVLRESKYMCIHFSLSLLFPVTNFGLDLTPTYSNQRKSLNTLMMIYVVVGENGNEEKFSFSSLSRSLIREEKDSRM